MIAKHVSNKVGRKSSFGVLAKYITSTQEKETRIAAVWTVNCHSQDPDVATCEVLATQNKNTRSKSDKTYHLLVSFPEGEKPSEKVLRDIEKEICASIGFAEHQRIVAAHDDTDNFHLHIAINKVHPTNHKCVTPHRDYYALQKACEMLEKKHGLMVDNHRFQQTTSEAKAKDMERHSGQQSFISWAREHLKEPLENAETWDEVHEALHKHGAWIRKKANGFVVETENGHGCKASSISRKCSYKRMIDRLGEFKPSGFKKSKKRKEYDKKPVEEELRSSSLYERYQNEPINQQTYVRFDRAGFKKEVETIKKQAKLQRMAIRQMKGNYHLKKLVYRQLYKNTRRKFGKAYDNASSGKSRANRTTWGDWLKSEAEKGNVAALEAMRKRKAKAQRALLKNTLAAKEANSSHDAQAVDGVTKTGSVRFKGKHGGIKDEGKHITVSSNEEQSVEVASQALRLAIAKYGNKLEINGSDAFKNAIVVAAVADGLDVTFKDAELEQQRINLTRNVKNDRRQRSRDRSTDEQHRKRRRRRTGDAGGSRGMGGVGGMAGVGRWGVPVASHSSTSRRGESSAEQNRSNSMFNVQAGDMAWKPQGGDEMLLQTYARSHDGNASRRIDRNVRRDVSESKVTNKNKGKLK